MQMNLFEKLDLNSKACTTWSKGVHIANRSQGGYYMSLYRIDNFYVEIQYHTCYDGIVCVQAFACEEQLQPYLEQISLEGVLRF